MNNCASCSVIIKSNNNKTCSSCHKTICFKCCENEEESYESYSWTFEDEDETDDEDEDFRTSRCQIGRTGLGYCCHDFSYECNNHLCRLCEKICFRCHKRMCLECESKCATCSNEIKKNVCRKCIKSDKCRLCTLKNSKIKIL